MLLAWGPLPSVPPEVIYASALTWAAYLLSAIPSGGKNRNFNAETGSSWEQRACARIVREEGVVLVPLRLIILAVCVCSGSESTRRSF